jgi:hypothetical protein
MMKNGKAQRTGIPALRERVERLQAELAGVADAIAALERERDADLAEYEGRLSAAEQEAAGARAAQAEALTAAEETERKGRALVSSGEKLLREAAAQRAVAEEMDLAQAPVRAASQALRGRREHWKAKLAEKQSGDVRRKRAMLERDIAKLERRAARKVGETLAEGPVPVLPKDRGTQPVQPAQPDQPNGE